MSIHNVDGMTPYFDTTVQGTGPALLLAHGAGGSIDGNFGPLLDALATSYTVIGPDYPGSGATPRSDTPLTLDMLADGVVAATDADRFTVLGYSLGSAVAVRIATRFPERVSKLILTSGFAHPDSKMTLALTVWRDLLGVDRTVVARYLTLLASGATRLESLSPVELDAAVAGLADVLPEGSAEHIEVGLQVDVTGDLAGITVPVLVIATTHDALVPPKLSSELVAGLPNAELIEIEAGHNIATEAPDAWMSAITTWMEKHR